jgi:hypothetical protein
MLCHSGGFLERRKQTFLTKSKAKHNNKYNYDLVDYKGAFVHVQIECPIHGVFEQKPRDHVNGNGCQRCGGKLRLTTSVFIERAKEKHGDTYDYSQVVYVRNTVNVNIICSIHGIFEQSPASHLRGCGCSKCNGGYTKDISCFLNRALDVHGDKYIYDNVVYTNSESLVDIFCPQHGLFKQTPNNHLNGGYGCPKCGHTRKDGRYNARYFEKFPERKAWSAIFYIIKFSNENEIFIKVGITIQDTINHRFRMSIYDGYKLDVLVEWNSTLYECWTLENLILNQFKTRKHYFDVDRKWYGKYELLDIRVTSDVINLVQNHVAEDAILGDNAYTLMDRRF